MNNKDIVSKMLKASEKIHQKSLRGSGNYIIVNSQVANAIRHMDITKERQDKINKILKRIKNKNE